MMMSQRGRMPRNTWKNGSYDWHGRQKSRKSVIPNKGHRMLLIDHLKKYHSFEERDFGPGHTLRFNSRNGVNVLETHGTLKRLFSRHHFVPVSNIFRNGDQIKIR